MLSQHQDFRDFRRDTPSKFDLMRLVLRDRIALESDKAKGRTPETARFHLPVLFLALGSLLAEAIQAKAISQTDQALLDKDLSSRQDALPSRQEDRSPGDEFSALSSLAEAAETTETAEASGATGATEAAGAEQQFIRLASAGTVDPEAEVLSLEAELKAFRAALNQALGELGAITPKEEASSRPQL
ncbi:MAG: hypothetical protein EB069_06755, partial [Actinobacteria bacterium]|nr:hypothetical protein [Actinomycetota bacterium]